MTDTTSFLLVLLAAAAAPFIASGILLIGVTGADKNYSLLFLIAAAFVLVGGLVILRIRSVR